MKMIASGKTTLPSDGIGELFGNGVAQVGIRKGVYAESLRP